MQLRKESGSIKHVHFLVWPLDGESERNLIFVEIAMIQFLLVKKNKLLSPVFLAKNSIRNQKQGCWIRCQLWVCGRI